jgi:DNA invertase Pin-like site-specific DNA recombinase
MIGQPIAAIYARVSTTEQDEKVSSVTQIEAAVAYARDLGFAVDPALIFNDARTGTSLDRPQLDALREAVRTGKVRVVVVYSLDRISRDQIDYGILRREFHQNGVDLYFAKDHSKAGKTSQDQTLETFLARQAQFELEQMTDRSRRGLRGKIASGQVLGNGHPPYGYDFVGNRADVQLVIVPEEAKIVRLVFEWFLHGDSNRIPLSTREIAYRLMDMGIDNPHMSYYKRTGRRKGTAPKYGNGIWSANAIYAMLDNPIYCGTWYYNRRAQHDNVYRLNNESEWRGVEVPAILEPSYHEAVLERRQTMRQSRQRSPDDNAGHFLMSRRLHCECGCMLAYEYHTHRRPNNRQYIYLYYSCGSRSRRFMGDLSPKGVCRFQSRINATILDDVVWGWIVETLPDPTLVEKRMRAPSVGYADKLRRHDEEARLYEGMLQEIKRKLEKLALLFVNDELPIEILRNQADELKEQQVSIEGKLTELVQRRMVVYTEEQVASTKDLVENVRAHLGEATIEDRRWLAEVLDVRGRLVRRGNDMHLHVTSVLDHVGLEGWVLRFPQTHLPRGAWILVPIEEQSGQAKGRGEQ